MRFLSLIDKFKIHYVLSGRKRQERVLTYDYSLGILNNSPFKHFKSPILMIYTTMIYFH